MKDKDLCEGGTKKTKQECPWRWEEPRESDGI